MKNANKSMQIDKTKLQQSYHKADDKGKQILEDLFGKDVFNDKIVNKIKTFKDACKMENVNCKAFLSKCKKNNDSKDEIAYKKLKIIARAINEGWVPDFNNESEYKYYPYFNAKSGFGFSCAYYAYTNADSTVGFCLCFKTRELAEYAGRQFESIYKDYLA